MAFDPTATYSTTIDAEGAIFILQGGVYYDTKGNSFATIPKSYSRGFAAVSPPITVGQFVTTAGAVYTFPTTSATLARTDAAQTFTGNQSISGTLFVSSTVAIGAGKLGSSALSVTDDAVKTSISTPLTFGTATGGASDFQLVMARSASGSGAYHSLQSLEQSIGYRNIALQPQGGKVLIGLTAENTSGGCLQLVSGITFPATQIAASDANTLDDYEEGTWTATLTLGGGSVTYSAQTGTYTKVGRLVTIQCGLVINVATTPSGAVTVAGLPFTSSATSKGAAAIMPSGMAATSATAVVGIVNASATAIQIYRYAAGSLASPGADIANGCALYITASYEV